MKVKLNILCLIICMLFIHSTNVFAAATLAKETDTNYNELKSLYNSANKIEVSNASVVTIYGKSDCNGTKCSITYAGVGSSDFKTALSKLVVCTNGEKNILYQVGSATNHDFKEDNREQYSGTVYWGEEYQVTCSSASTGDTNIQLNNNVSGGSNTGNSGNTGNNTGNTGNTGNSGYQSSDTVDPSETGVTTYFVVLGLISILSYGVMLLIKKYNLFKNI